MEKHKYIIEKCEICSKKRWYDIFDVHHFPITKKYNISFWWSPFMLGKSIPKYWFFHWNDSCKISKQLNILGATITLNIK